MSISIENTEQPPPKPGTARATWDLVIADMHERDQLGASKYGRRHQHDNGRDHLVDALQEGYDLVCYLRAEVEKRKRLRELARVVRSAENSGPLTELLDLIEAGTTGDGATNASRRGHVFETNIDGSHTCARCFMKWIVWHDAGLPACTGLKAAP